MLDLSRESLVENISACKKCKKRFAEISSSQALEVKTSGMFSGGPGFGDLNHSTFAVMSLGEDGPMASILGSLEGPHVSYNFKGTPVSDVVDEHL